MTGMSRDSWDDWAQIWMTEITRYELRMTGIIRDDWDA